MYRASRKTMELRNAFNQVESSIKGELHDLIDFKAGDFEITDAYTDAIGYEEQEVPCFIVDIASKDKVGSLIVTFNNKGPDINVADDSDFEFDDLPKTMQLRIRRVFDRA